MEYPSRRAAVWTKEHVSEALAESLLDLCTKFNVCDISDIPVCCLGAVNEDGQIELGEGFTQEDRKFNGRNCSAISRCWMFKSKTRDYRRLYRDVAIRIEKGEMKLEDVT